mmetsp:Transcript_15517/g.38447  ORF Transcript_15517/g.38447 Transcript_15517/m.38447 type:complete len:254 (-) Transcript_15517:470-1231(-)
MEIDWVHLLLQQLLSFYVLLPPPVSSMVYQLDFFFFLPFPFPFPFPGDLLGPPPPPPLAGESSPPLAGDLPFFLPFLPFPFLPFPFFFLPSPPPLLSSCPSCPSSSLEVLASSPLSCSASPPSPTTTSFTTSDFSLISLSFRNFFSIFFLLLASTHIRRPMQAENPAPSPEAVERSTSSTDGVIRFTRILAFKTAESSFRGRQNSCAVDSRMSGQETSVMYPGSVTGSGTREKEVILDLFIGEIKNFFFIGEE